MVMARVQMRSAMRAAAVSLVEDYIADTSGDTPDWTDRIQVYRTIPTTIVPPTAFPERISETQIFTGPTQRQRTVTVRMLVLWRLFAEMERGDAVDQLDAFLDGFTDWSLTHFHEPGPTQLISTVRIDDDPYYSLNDPKLGIRTYYAGRIDLEGYTTN